MIRGRTISFPKKELGVREELCVPSCVLSSPLAFAPVAQRPARKINVPSPSEVCECLCGVAQIPSSPDSLQMQAD